jgi:hypothetical protein
MTEPQPITPKPDDELKPRQRSDDDLRDFLVVVHRAGKLILGYIEKRYGIGDEADKRKRAA